MSDPPFIAGNPSSIAAYRSRLIALRASYNDLPLAEGMAFDLVLKSPPRNPSVTGVRPLQISSAQLDVETRFALTKPLQIGSGYHSQVWMAQPLSSTPDQTGSLVLKFVIPSYIKLPSTYLEESEVRLGQYLFPANSVEYAAAAYEKLPELQGSSLPYFYGVHNVNMHWGETVFILAMEYIAGPSLADLQKVIDSENSTSKYCDFNVYRGLFHMALDVVRAAHAKDVYHIDIRGQNILIDEENDHPVFIDWQNVTIQWAVGPLGVTIPNPFITQEYIDMQHLMSTFYDSKHHNERMVKYIAAELPDVERYWV
ncbi:serine/threonine kinase, SPS1 [Schizophyllum amplum]|uniref:Serine/threonine kinase, SPS1 n=1 Tax=Schizophyllum amplum TaxID=97359 RepID=A0A550CQR5_9AGAR|nr:serine/threonine kinase, SPS1 [Auriculariopsis ampla]